MQKAHSRINWENLPSINTPLGANNLNKMDKALDVVDDRVLSLYGYEGRVAQSEKNAKTSETNAKTSETNAKQSELKAKEYMESAFSGTPEGYEQLVEDVRLMDIQTTTDTTLLNSKAGGYKLLSMSGKSVQNGIPTPDAPQSIHNVGDCVEITKGAFYSSNGTFSSGITGYVSGKNKIPCKSGDVVKIVTETICNINVFFYNESGYISFGYKNNTTEHSVTAPSGATYFTFSVGNNTDTTVDTVGKISLTINGKYVVQIPYANKNLITVASSITKESAGYVFDKTTKADLKAGTQYVFSCVTSVTQSNKMQIGLWYKDGTSGTVPSFSSNANEKATCVFTPAKDVEAVSLYQGVGAMVITDCQIEQGTVATDYEPRKEKVATVLLNAPLCDTDVMSRTEVVRKRASVVFDGSADELWEIDATDRMVTRNYANLIIKTTNNATVPNILCSQYSPTSADNTYLQNMGISCGTVGVIQVYDPQFTTLAEWLTHLSSNPMEFEYELAEEVIETLDTDSQIALNSLETFDTVTYINVDSRVQPSEIKGEYGTSKVGARTIKNDLKNDTLEIKYNELAVALVATERRV